MSPRQVQAQWDLPMEWQNYMSTYLSYKLRVWEEESPAARAENKWREVRNYVHAFLWLVFLFPLPSFLSTYSLPPSLPPSCSSSMPPPSISSSILPFLILHLLLLIVKPKITEWEFNNI